jgi:hypothetical protein
MNLWTHGGWATVGLGVVMLAGCHMSPYGPGYYNAGPMYGPTYSAPQQYMAPGPGPVYTPQNLGPTPVGPNLGSPTPISPSSPSQGTPTWRPDPNNGLNDAPPYKPNNGVVPEPFDPDFSAPPGAASVPRAVPVSPVAGTAPQIFPGNDPDPFETPAQPLLKPAGSSSSSTPYSYDGDNYTFVKGIVDYDAASQTWSIIYDLHPKDKFGGSFIFAAHPQLQTLKRGDLVLAKGRVDPGRTDSRGKPLYEVGTLTVLPPLPIGQ